MHCPQLTIHTKDDKTESKGKTFTVHLVASIAAPRDRASRRQRRAAGPPRLCRDSERGACLHGESAQRAPGQPNHESVRAVLRSIGSGDCLTHLRSTARGRHASYRCHSPPMSAAGVVRSARARRQMLSSDKFRWPRSTKLT